MAPSIRVDNEVYDVLKGQAEPFVDSPNSVLRRILGLEQIAAAVQLDSRSEVREVAEPSSSTRSDRRKTGRSKTRGRRKSASRAPRGAILPESEYEQPLLRALGARGGSAPAREVIDAVGETLADQLTPLDKEKLSSGGVRWENRVQFVRLRLIEQGLLAKDSPRGVWKLTEAGRQRASAVA